MARMKLSLWDKLSNRDTPAGAQFMAAFDELNTQLGNALGRLPEQPQDIQGRDREIRMLHAILERPKTPVALLLGQAGVGKTALVEQFAKDLNSGALDTELNNQYLLVSLRLGTLASLGTNQLQTRLSTLLDDIKTLQDTAQDALGNPNIKVVLFMDEVHMLVTIFGPGTKVGGDVMKDVLARSPIRVIAATTRREYDSTIAVDQPLSERFKQIEIHELDPEIVLAIAKNWWAKVAPDLNALTPDDATFRKIIDANAMYRSDSAEPRKSLDILEDLVSYSRRTGVKATAEQVNDIFRRRYSISLSFDVTADDIYAEVDRRIKGQPFAKHTIRRLLRTMVFQLDPTSNKPMATALFTGPTGVGKTETVKALADSMYPGQPVILNMNMPDFKTAEHEPAFRKKLGEFVRHTPNAIVLFDELEKGAEEVKDSLLAILDEGIVNYETRNREGNIEVNSVSLRNTVIVATTNAGADVFDNDARFSQREATGKDELSVMTEAEMDQLQQQLRRNLIETNFKPELLGRFQRIVPYRSLSTATILEIADKQLDDLFTKLESLRGITITHNDPVDYWSDNYPYKTSDLSLYISAVKTNATDSKAGGARAVRREIETGVLDSLIDAVYTHPDSSRFHIDVSKDSKIYVPGAAPTEGGIRVTALN